MSLTGFSFSLYYNCHLYVSLDELSRMGWGCGQVEEASVFVFAVDGKSHGSAILV